MKSTIWLDFWTTNSTIWFNNWNNAEMIKLTKDSYEDRTVLFFNNEEREFVVWKEAIEEQILWESWRLIMSPKSFLNSKEEITTIVWWKPHTLNQLITVIVSDFKNRLEKISKEEWEDILVWRPVSFHDESEQLDKLAQNRLEDSVKAAWYKNVEFQYEPIAAARSYKENSNEEENIIIADFWWWTSDFSILNLNPKEKWTKWMKVIANNWVYVWWDLLDFKLSTKNFAKDLWFWSLQTIMWKDLEVPSQYYHMLSDWKQIDKLRKRDVLLKLQEIYGRTKNPELFKRLIEVSQEPSLWYEYYQLIENTKRELSTKNIVKKQVNIFSEPYNKEINRKDFEQMINQEVLAINKTIKETLKQSWLDASKINKIIMTWWTSLVPIVRDTVESILWKWKIINSDTFTSVWYWLTLESYERFR